MSKLSNLSMKAKVACLVLTFATGFLAFAGITFTTIQSIRVGGTQYAEIVEDKDLLADALPPALYVIETYLSTHIMQDSTDPIAKEESIKRYREYRSNFEASLDAWSKKLTDGKIKDLLTKKVAKTAKALFASIE